MWMAGIVFILLIKIVPRYTLKYSIFDRFYYSQQLINLNHIGHSSASYSNSTVLKWWQILLNICGNWQAFTLMHAFSYFFFLYELRLMVIKHILLLYYFLLTVVNQCLHLILFCFQYSFVYLKKKNIGHFTFKIYTYIIFLSFNSETSSSNHFTLTWILVWAIKILNRIPIILLIISWTIPK